MSGPVTLKLSLLSPVLNDPDTLDRRPAIAGLCHRIDADAFQFRHKFRHHAIAQCGPFLHLLIDQRGKFIPRHHAISVESSVRIPFYDTIAIQLGNFVVGPVIFRNIGE